jgi:DNA-binding transcriptional LysR family regulator
VLSVHALGSLLAPQGGVVLPVQGFPIPSQWHVVRRRTRSPSPIAQACADHLQAQVAAV